MKRWVLAAFFLTASAVVFSPGPIVTTSLSGLLDVPVEARGVRWVGPGDWSADSVQIGREGRMRAQLDHVTARGLLSFLAGGRMAVHFGRLRVGGEAFERSAAWFRRRPDGLRVFTRLVSVSGRASGGVLWRMGRLIKAHARVTLTGAGLGRVPEAWAGRLAATPDGPAFIVLYVADRLVVRGRNGPLVEAAWQPA